MGKKIEFKTASMIRGQQPQQLPDDVTKKIDAWIMSNPDNKPMEPERTAEQNVNVPAMQTHKTVRLNINIAIDTHKEVKKICAERGVSITDFVTQLLHNEMRT